MQYVVRTEIRPRDWALTSCLSQSVNVIEIDTGRSGPGSPDAQPTYDLLLVIHNNYEFISYHCQDIRWQKHANTKKN